jgi:hypothetical protein
MSEYSDVNEEADRLKSYDIEELKRSYSNRSDYRESLGSLVDLKSLASSGVLYSSGYTDKTEDESVSSSSVKEYNVM